MSFISYAQNYEDVFLWRCFGHLEKGFYIDIGAAWPKMDSVTHAFYEKGWHGINVEPNEQLHAELLRERIRDINIQHAVGEKDENIDIYFFRNMGLSTAVKSIAEGHIARGEVAEIKSIAATTLKSICEKHLPSQQAIHFLKIDVEGLEREVILGHDFSLYRPQVVIVESTLPMSTTPCWDDWEDLLVKAGYQFTYFDGLNRFYIDKEHAYLAKHFEIPVNLWDDVIRADGVAKNQELDMKNHELNAKSHELHLKSQELEHLQIEFCSQRDILNRRIQELYQSRSWRLTAPLRWFSEKCKRNKGNNK